MAGKKNPSADRSHGGPGSSTQDASKPEAERRTEPVSGEPTNPSRSRVSGGGGEHDIHHTHNPPEKGKGRS